jgi:hypothetical protein
VPIEEGIRVDHSARKTCIKVTRAFLRFTGASDKAHFQSWQYHSAPIRRDLRSVPHTYSSPPGGLFRHRVTAIRTRAAAFPWLDFVIGGLGAMYRDCIETCCFAGHRVISQFGGDHVIQRSTLFTRNRLCGGVHSTIRSARDHGLVTALSAFKRNALSHYSSPLRVFCLGGRPSAESHFPFSRMFGTAHSLVQCCSPHSLCKLEMFGSY